MGVLACRGAGLKILLCHPGASFSVSDVYNGLCKALKAQGHEVIEYRLDGRIDSMGGWLDYQWRKAGKPDPRPTWADKLYLSGVPLFERALRTLPDWVVVVSAMYVHPDLLVLLKRLGVPTAYVFTESPYDLDKELKVAPLANVIFTNERSCVDAFRAVQPHSYYLPHAYDPEVHRPDVEIPDDTPRHDVVFVGTGFQERIDILSAVDWEGIDLGLYGTWGLLGSRHQLRRFVRSDAIPNKRATELYRAARIGLNLYRTSRGYGRFVPRIQHAESMNPRAYELAACGVYQISDWRAEALELFGDTCVGTARTASDMGKLIRAALNHDTFRQNMAQHALEAVTPHTFAARAQQLTDTLSTVARDRASASTRMALQPTG